MKYLISMSYDGSKFYGFQRLKNKDTIQKRLEDALSIIAKKDIKIKGAGRTDKGVHAYDAKVTFDLDINIKEYNLKRALNSLIAPYIYIKDIKTVNNNFHPRFNCVKKEYIYKINIGEYNPLYTDYYYQPNYKLDINKMEECAKIFIGVHNFKNFTSGVRPNYECIIYDIDFHINESILEIKFTGKSFYRYMVRNLVGAMLDVANNKASLEEIKKSLDKPEIKRQFKTAIPNGLYLNKIEYEEETC
ncbi:MAG TPA: tRNA pseudouridine(38-40) synthase TruA [Candidatus Caccenecus avistercoris]|nr:tRNA pseudouridine(38-40) synthase TruA [Candidatus Caccenecus avistercoris]